MTPTTVLVPMTESDFARFVAETVPSYAADKVASGQWSPEESLALARRALDELLPQGLATPGHHLFTIRDGAPSPAVGRLWFAEQERAGRRIAYVYDIEIAPEHRRSGHAAGALRALEAEVARRGLAGIALHVFGHNHAARALYAKLGYQPTNINLYKPVDAAAG